MAEETATAKHNPFTGTLMTVLHYPIPLSREVHFPERRFARVWKGVRSHKAVHRNRAANLQNERLGAGGNGIKPGYFFRFCTSASIRSAALFWNSRFSEFN